MLRKHCYFVCLVDIKTKSNHTSNERNIEHKLSVNKKEKNINELCVTHFIHLKSIIQL